MRSVTLVMSPAAAKRLQQVLQMWEDIVPHDMVAYTRLHPTVKRVYTTLAGQLIRK